MNKNTIATMAAVLMGVHAISAQTVGYTKPSGFVKHTLKKDQINLLGLTMHKSVIVSGTLDTVVTNDNGTPGSNSPEVDDDYSELTDDQVDFSSTLTTGKTYILEITDAVDTSLNGVIQEVTAWSDNTFETPQDLNAEGLA